MKPILLLSFFTAFTVLAERPVATWTERTAQGARDVTAEIWTAQFQAELDAKNVLHIPARSEPYYIDGPLILKSGAVLTADATAEIRLKSDTCTCMVRNEHVAGFQKSPVPATLVPDTNITVRGGIWITYGGPNGNGYGRSSQPKPIQGSHGVLLFLNVRDLTIRDVTIRESKAYAVHLSAVSRFTVDGVTLIDHGRDGVHVNGPASDGVIRNVHGNAFDDIVALNAWDWKNAAPNFGPIENIRVENITGAPHGVRSSNEIRLLPGIKKYDDGTTLDCALRNITLTNITEIATVKMYNQPNLELGRDNDFSHGLGNASNILIDGLVMNRPCTIEVHSDVDGLTIRNLDKRFTKDNWHLIEIGPRSVSYPIRKAPDGTQIYTELFSPDLDCTVRRLSVPDEKLVKLIALRPNPDYPKTQPKGGIGKGIWIR